MATSTAPPAIRVQPVDPPGEARVYREEVRIGRGERCEVQVRATIASRVHARLVVCERRWWIEDCDSTNGTYHQGEPIARRPVTGPMVVQLGTSGPRLRIDRPDERDANGEGRARTTDGDAGPPDGSGRNRARENAPSGDLRRRLVGERPADRRSTGIPEGAGRRAARWRRTYLGLLAGVLLLCVLLGGYAVWQRHRTGQLRAQAEEVWAGMKKQEVLISQLKQRMETVPDSALQARLSALTRQHTHQEARYRGYVRELGLRRNLTPVEKTIYRVARLFGESEFSVPAGFVRRVKATIRDYWTGPAREGYVRALRRAEQRGYTARIVDTLRSHGLPPEFFYLALQESRFDPRAVGPRTSSGIAKGLWQFIPETARTYGLQLGPRVQQRAYDPQDERHDVNAATGAAADYLQFLYDTRAQASGLLVVASYNWGEDRVVGKVGRLTDSRPASEGLVGGLPADSARRNYWHFLKAYGDRMPDETRDYVLKVFAAAVIGQNPEQFGFTFENPLLEHLERPPPGDPSGPSPTGDGVGSERKDP